MLHRVAHAFRHSSIHTVARNFATFRSKADANFRAFRRAVRSGRVIPPLHGVNHSDSGAIDPGSAEAY